MALNIVNTGNVTDDPSLELNGVRGIASAVVNGTTYVYATGHEDFGISAFALEPSGAFINVQNIADDGTVFLGGAINAITVAVGASTFLAVSGFLDNGVSVFRINNDGTLTNTDNVADDPNLQMLSTFGLASAQIGAT